ncbi:MAG TPA: M6 family metalloprotease domain-containing protein [Polyangiaceae bacterium]|nr:M6 family metalloprotease domain-containing protein [Polyangiaceae bacterium]
MKFRRLSSWSLFGLGGLLAFTSARTAGAVIVSEGHIVEAWPEAAAAAHALPPGVALAQVGGFFPQRKGTIRGLTLLVNFSDEPGAFTREEIEEWLNAPGYSRFNCNGSVRDYYKDVSNGAVDLVNTVHAYYRAKNPKSYYEGGNGYERAGELMKELLAAVDPAVDFSQFDNDGDGRTEAISVVYAGPSVEWGQGLWPHSGSLSEKRDGVSLPRYQMTNMGKTLSLYTFVHETGHMVFGWPDLYGFGDYCVMGNATNPVNPAGINDFFRADQGWIPTVDVVAATNASYIATPNGAGYRFMNPNNSKELFFWSNIQPKNRWSVLRGGGLLLLHYDGTIRGNDPPNPLQLAVVQADGKKDLDKTTWPSPGSDSNDFYRSGGRSEISATTTPNSSWNNGSASGLRVHSVSASGNEMSFSVGTGVAGAPSASGGTTSGGASSGGAGSGGRNNGGATNGGRNGGGANSGGASNGGATGGAAGGSSARGGAPSQGGSPQLGGSSSVPGAGGGGNNSGTGGVLNSAGMFGAGGATASGGSFASAGGGSSVAGMSARGGAANEGNSSVGAGGATTAGSPPRTEPPADSSGWSCTTAGHAGQRGTWLGVACLASVLTWTRRRSRARTREA